MILVDSRLGSRDLISYAPLNSDSVAMLASNLASDVEFPGLGPDDSPVMIMIEFKSVRDLLSSVTDGRLQREQIPKMIGDSLAGIPRACDVAWILVYGRYQYNLSNGSIQLPVRCRKGEPYDWVEYNNGAWRWEDVGGPVNQRDGFTHVEGFLASPSFTELRIGFKHLNSIPECALWIYNLYRLWQKPYADHQSMNVFNRAGSSPMRVGMSAEIYQRAYTAQTLPGLGMQKALAVARKWTIREMIIATEEEWAAVEVKGEGSGSGSKGKSAGVDGKTRRMTIGKGTARKVQEALDR